MIGFKATGLDDFIKGVEKEALKSKRSSELRLARVGEMYISESRSKGSYQDQTGNLRNANSYAVYRDGVLLYGSFGRPETQSFFDSKKHGIGLELIVGNGMEYTSFVEGKGFNVCSSGFLKVESEVRKLMI